MNRKKIWAAVLGAGLLAILAGGCASESARQVQLEARAKVTKAEATATALTKVPNGTIKEAELEEEKGKLIWSFDLATPGTKDITEVAVDAMSGEVVAVGKETAESEAAEKAGDSEKEKGKETPK